MVVVGVGREWRGGVIGHFEGGPTGPVREEADVCGSNFAGWMQPPIFLPNPWQSSDLCQLYSWHRYKETHR